MKKFSLQSIFDKRIKQTDFVLLYQIEKLGAMSIERSLKRLDIPNWKTHTFDDSEEFLIYKNKGDIKHFVNWRTRLFNKLLLNYRCHILKQRDYLKIITLIRDPIATVLSRFFDDLHLQFIQNKQKLDANNDIDQSVDFLIERFDKHIQFDYFADWFARELQKNFSVDILSHIKSSNRDHWRIEQSGRDILLMKAEAMDSLSAVLEDFLEEPNFHLLHANTNNKGYASLYQQFVKTYPLDKLFYLYQTPVYQRIYRREEIETFKQKWSAV